MDDELTPIDNDEMMNLFGDVPTDIPEVIAEDNATPLEEDIMEQTRNNEQKKKQVRDAEDNKDRQAFVMCKESVMKKHKNISAER